MERLVSRALYMKEDGLNLLRLAARLSPLLATLSKKYYHQVSLRGLLRYLVNRLKYGQGRTDILQELVEQMGGIGSNENPTADQLQAMAGGRC